MSAISFKIFNIILLNFIPYLCLFLCLFLKLRGKSIKKPLMVFIVYVLFFAIPFSYKFGYGWFIPNVIQPSYWEFKQLCNLNTKTQENLPNLDREILYNDILKKYFDTDLNFVKNNMKPHKHTEYDPKTYPVVLQKYVIKKDSDRFQNTLVIFVKTDNNDNIIELQKAFIEPLWKTKMNFNDIFLSSYQNDLKYCEV
ncbi:hypothetical protein OFO01_07505 [Campylobacter sp. JMF_01 NE2]|uniref:hypothetical protein n=1 Tax=unclassified Campylobacter TaxID=2593542 RepID=UPI0022E9D9BC|nr:MULTISPECIES: hypothetical protein [unclassified Campylobacter]MDA3053189.1 hypothetical protein [Campylobacter sp. JMF_03 NE3]MDA3067628.1 hypothetical protein [Campylobacter sp. JMF_01 NE2]